MAEKASNGAVAVLTTLAQSGDAWIKLGTLALVALSGLGNFLATERTGKENRHQMERDIHEIWKALDRNKEEFRQLTLDAATSRRLLEDLERSRKDK